MKQVKVISLDAVQNIDEGMVGAKAMSLAKMSRSGFTAGFAVLPLILNLLLFLG